MKRILLFLTTILLATISIASAPKVSGAGIVAHNLMEPVTILSNFIGSMSIVVGLTAVFASFLRYMQYRVNPLASPLSTVLLLLILGIVLLVLPLIYKLTSSGIPIAY